MKNIALLLSAAMLVSACGREGAAETNNVAVVANEPAATPEAENLVVPAAETAAGDLSAQYMVGKWSAMEEDCSATLDFSNDGKVVTPIGEAKWTLAGDKLTLDYGDGAKPTTSTLKSLSADRIEITTASGRKETQKRC